MRLRRFVDSLQRGLFDEPHEAGPPAGKQAPLPLPPAPPAGASTADPGVLLHPRATRNARLQGQAVGYLLRRSRRRTIGFVVGAEGLTVTAPKWVALRDIDAALQERGAWILAKLAEQRQRAARQAAARVVWADGATFPYLGRPLRIVLDARQGLAEGEVRLAGRAPLDGVVGAGGAREAGEPGEAGEAGGADRTDSADGPVVELHVGLPRGAAETRVRDAVQSWLQREARRVFAERAAHFAARLDVRVTRLSLSSAHTRWGSASATGAVRLHWRLIHFALPTIDYVVAHELAHLREMNHSARFWRLVESVIDDAPAARQALRAASLTGLD